MGYTPGANRLRDADNAKAAVPGFTGKAVSNNTPDRAPQLVRAYVNQPGTHLVLVYNEPLASAFPNTAAFTVNVDDSTRGVSTLASDPSQPAKMALILASDVNVGQTVTVSYDTASAGGTNKKIQDAAGNFAASFTNESVSNNTAPVFSSAAVNGSALTITFDAALDEAAGSVPAATDFAVTVGSDTVSLAETDPVAVSGSTVTLTLAKAVLRNDTLTVGYTPGTNKLKDADNAMAVGGRPSSTSQ